jgi:Tfp pilus assembly protein PilF
MHSTRARAYGQTGDLASAERDYRAVLAIDPQRTAAQARLERLLAPAAAPD